MKKSILIWICIGLNIACQTEEQLPAQVGQLTANSNSSAYLDVEKISNIGEFNLAYKEKSQHDKNFRFLLPYDFDRKEITTSQDIRTGIPIMGTPYDCLIYCCNNTDVLIEVASEQEHQIELGPLDKVSLKKWIRQQILNNGQDPALSDNPQDAIFKLVFDEKQPFSDANLLLYQLVEAYEEFLKERATIEQLDIKLIKEKYPLNLRFATKAPPATILPTDCEEEIFEEIDIDLNLYE